MKKLLIIVFSLVFCNLFCKNSSIEIIYLDSAQKIIDSETISIQEFNPNNYQNLSDKKPNPVIQLFRKKQRLNKKITAAVLAFPFPFGIVGLHRIYLGTKPFVPVAYIASLGGVFGILPFIDFCAITFDKDFDHYKNNDKVFMWIK